MARPRSAVSRYKHRKNNDPLKIREAVLYARVSTPDQQREGYSIPAQVKLLEDYAALNGIAIVSSHIDVETARKSGRIAFGNMLRHLRRHPEVRIILVEKTDRYYRCSGFRGKCPERFVRQEVLEEHFVELLRKLWCDRLRFENIRDRLGTRSGEELSADRVTTLRQRNLLPGTPGALLRDGLALLDMGRTAHLQLANLPDEMKQQVLSLVFLRCSWAHEELAGWFNSPFDILASCVADGGAGEARASVMTQLSNAFGDATPEIRLLIARYNAMSRLASDVGVFVPSVQSEEFCSLAASQQLPA